MVEAFLRDFFNEVPGRWCMFMQKIERAFGFDVQPDAKRPPRVDRNPSKPADWGFFDRCFLYVPLGFIQVGLQKIQEETGYQKNKLHKYTKKVSF